ncbi:MAG: alginate export family protein [Gammaproteobacteria bacterium]|nr:alginate export family protein [Gammaproteobacteria bacterium]
MKLQGRLSVHRVASIGVMLMGAFGAVPLVAGQALEVAATGSTVKLDLRYRYEFVNQSGFADEAKASTLRGRLNFTTPTVNDFMFMAELDAVVVVGADNYNSGAGTSSPRRNRYPVVADPDYLEANQLYLQFEGFSDTRVRVGRQRILLDNQRFVGGVGWRQNEQTYDAVRITNKSIEASTIDYAFVRNVNRIFGDDVAAGDHSSETHLLNLQRSFGKIGSLTAYYYGIENDDAAAFSSDTFGIRFAGKSAALKYPLTYTVEVATQSDAANNPVNYDAGYLRLDAALDFASVTGLLGYEVLGGDANNPGRAFRTPIATLHGFNGWADQFLTTPGAGLTDLYVGAKGKAGRFAWQALWHDFSAEDGSADYGREIDAVLSTRFGGNYSAMLKVANFNAANSNFPNVTKFWLMVSASY